MFKDQFRKCFEIKIGSVSTYLEKRVTVDQNRQNVILDQTEFVSELLERFGMKDSTPVSTPMVAWLSSVQSPSMQVRFCRLQTMISTVLLWYACSTWPAGQDRISLLLFLNFRDLFRHSAMRTWWQPSIF